MGIARAVIDALGVRTEPGRRARAIRRALRRSRRKVARSAGLTRHQLAGIERGRRPVAPAQWRSLAGSLGVDAELLLPADQWSADDLDAENRKIDEFLEHDVVQGWAVIDLSDPEPRTDEPTGAGVERSWSDIRTDLDDLVACCDRLVVAETGEDADALLDMLEAATHEVRFRSPSRWAVSAESLNTVRGLMNTERDTNAQPGHTL